MAPNAESQPLLEGARAKKTLNLGSATAYALAVLRPLVGAVFVIGAPPALRQAFIPGEQFETTSVFLPRLVGIREIIIGGLLWKALRRSNANRDEVHGLILANVAVDTMDALSAGAALIGGKSTERAAAGWFCAGALLFVVFGLLGLAAY